MSMQEYNYVYCGLELSYVPDLNVALEDAKSQDYDFIAVPLAHPRYERDLTGTTTRYEAFTRYLFVSCFILVFRIDQ